MGERELDCERTEKVEREREKERKYIEREEERRLSRRQVD